MNVRILASVGVLLILSAVSLGASPVLSGLSWFDMQADSSVLLDDLSFGTQLLCDFSGGSLETDALVGWPMVWVWQGISGYTAVNGLVCKADILFGPSTGDFLYAQTLVSASIGGIDFAWHAAQLGNAVLGGPADGWALRVSAAARGLEIVSISEFGARIEDADFDGITIVHAATGEERHYATDPLVAGRGFTGEKASFRARDLACAELLAITVYASCTGLQYVALEATNLAASTSWVSLNTEMVLRPEAKDFSLWPTVVLDDTACFQLYADLAWDPVTGLIDGIAVSGLELACAIGSFRIRDVAVLDLSRYVITTEAHENQVEKLSEALAQGHDYYPDYWEMLSLSYTTQGCGGTTFSLLANSFFGGASCGLFDWAMSHVEATIPLSSSLSFSIQLEALSAGFSRFGFGVALSW